MRRLVGPLPGRERDRPHEPTEQCREYDEPDGQAHGLCARRHGPSVDGTVPSLRPADLGLRALGSTAAGEPSQVGVDHHRDHLLERDLGRPAELARALRASPRAGRPRPGGGSARRSRRTARQSRPTWLNASSHERRAPCASRRSRSRSRAARPAGASATSRARSRPRSPSRAARRGCRGAARSRSPSLMRATPSVILRVTNSRPRRGDSWLKRMPETANMLVALAIVDGDVVPVDLGHAVRAARIEGRVLVLRHLLHLAEHLRGRRLVEADRRIDAADRLEHARHAERR